MLLLSLLILLFFLLASFVVVVVGEIAVNAAVAVAYTPRGSGS